MICLAATGSAQRVDAADARSSRRPAAAARATMRKRRGLAGAVRPEQRIELAARTVRSSPSTAGRSNTW